VANIASRYSAKVMPLVSETSVKGLENTAA
jgi:hypothetical protein